MVNEFNKVNKGIKWVLDNCTSYQVAKDLGINNRTVNRYQNGESPLENMTLGTAEKLYNYYLKEMGNMMSGKYTVSALNEYETKYGMFVEDVAEQKSVHNEEQAVEVAKEMFDKGIYSSIYIEYAHHDSQCYYNPAVGHEPNGKDWVRHFEAMVNNGD